ncbi:unnamed protein product [Musa hybrid cultivar]
MAPLFSCASPTTHLRTLMRNPRRGKLALTRTKSRIQKSRKSLRKPTDNDDDAFPGEETAPLLSADRSSPEVTKKDEPAVFGLPSSTASKEQVVHLRVALHCKGCEGKVRKHISKMEGETGVTSFDIDFEAKKVTVVGAVTASGVLNSISKVKNAQLWPSSPPFLPSSSSSSCFHGT